MSLSVSPLAPSGAPRKTALLLALLPVLAACGRSPVKVEGDLLSGLAPEASRGIDHGARMTDGLVSVEGGAWNSDLAVTIPRGGAVTWDLGAARDLGWLYLQGDNNDRYEVEASLDGRSFSPLWTAGAVQGAGLRARSQAVQATARYLRIRPAGGDGAYSVAEFGAFARAPEDGAAPFAVRRGSQPADPARGRIWTLAAAALLFVAVYRPRGAGGVGFLPEAVVRNAWVLPAAAGGAFVFYLLNHWPLPREANQLFRASVAAVALAVLVRGSLVPEGLRLSRRFVNRALAVLALLAAAGYYDFGRLPFHHAGERRFTPVHTFDMRHYFPVAKYFPELQFDGLYLASLAAYLEDFPETSDAELRRVRVRDLTNNQVVTADTLREQAVGAKARFSPERWQSFTEDMRFFRKVMGPGDYLGTMRDHGGNATPVWILAANLLFRWLPANEWTLGLAGLVDPLLLLFMFVCIGRTFGVRPALVTAILWGATDFARFGATLVGSTMRYDWIVALGLAACALRSRRYVLGGALLAYSGLVRAFPAVAGLFLLAPFAWAVIEAARKARGLPRLAAVEGAKPFLRAVAGGLGAVALFVGLSSAVYGYQESWGAWFEKIGIHKDKPNVNHIGIRTLVSYEPEHVARKVILPDHPEPWTRWQETQLAAYEARAPLRYAVILGWLALALVAARRKSLEQAALLGMMLIPVLLYPANYYYHHILVLPLLAFRSEERDEGEPGRLFSLVSIYLLAVCALQYFTLGGWSDEVYTWQAFLLFGAYLAIFATVIAFDRRAARAPAVPAAEPAREARPRRRKARAAG
jgi:hypothetical protein